MAEAKRSQPTPRAGPGATEVAVRKPLKVAQGLGVVILVVGAVTVLLGVGVTFGLIKEGWGFPMSPVPNWGKPWGVVLVAFGAAQIICPLWLLARPKNGSIAMMIASGLCVLVGTPVIITTVEIFYNLFQQTKGRPEWIDAAWAYYMMLQVGTCVALYKAFPPPKSDAAPARASS